MKKLFAILLTLVVLLSLVACGKSSEEEKMTTLYLVTKIKDYNNGDIRVSHFQYDDHGRPIQMEVDAGDYVTKMELTYDDHSNLANTKRTDILPSGSTSVPRTSPSLTYSGNQLTRVVYNTRPDWSCGLDLEYDSAGRLTLVVCDEEYADKVAYPWHRFSYDDQGRLIKVTTCCQATGTISGASGHSIVYYLQSEHYRYDAAGNLSENYWTMSDSYLRITPEEADQIEETQMDRDSDHYFYHYADGKLDRIEDRNGKQVYSRSEFYSNPDYTFDEQGNLIRVQTSDTAWTEYTYEAIEVRETDAVMAKRLMRGILDNLGIRSSAVMDPMAYHILPRRNYSLESRCPSFDFYYLIPFPLVEIDF